RAHFLVGDLTSAEASAGQLDPSLRSGPRYASLLALILASKGQTDGALAVFDRVARMEESSVARVARAEVHRLRGDADATFADAQQVYEESNDASLRQKAWAHLLLAEAKWLGRNRDAATQLGAALSPIARDERFVLRLITLLRQVGALDEASAVVNALPEAAMRPGERSLVLAELALAKGDLDGAAQAVAQAPAGAQQAYLQGRLAEARNDLETAVARYQTAAEDEAQFVRAKTRLGVIALAQGELDDAIAHLQAARPNDPASEAIVVPLVDALLAKGSNDDALGAVTEALAADGDSVALLVAKAKVDLAKGDAVAALRALDPLAEGNPDDAALQATFGEAARRTGTRAKAEAGFANALRVQPRNQVALAGTVRLAIDGFDLEAGNAAFAAAREGGVPRRVLTLLEGRLLVMQGAGRRAVSKLRPLAERRRGRRWRTVGRDPEVWAAYGVALAQAEDDRNASRVLERAISYDGSVVDARLALAAVRTRRGDLTGASRLIGDAERLIESRRRGAFYEAWVLAARGRIMYENGNIGEARRLADEAIAKDPASAPGLFLLGIVEDADGRNAVDPLRRSLEGHFPAPESLGQLIVLDRRARDRCDLVQSYLARAPTGVDSRDARLARRRCRR
ncbi:MAG: tetratricopeptide repeat protein, partial [Myxococcota bacterium]